MYFKVKLTRRKRKILIAVLISSFISLFTILLWSLNYLDIFEYKSIDLRQKITRANKKTPEDIVITLIDEASLKALQSVYGRWPWPRSVHADLIRFLTISKAKKIIFDILFTEQMRKELKYEDEILSEATKEAGNVIYAAQIFEDIVDEFNKNILDRPMPDFAIKNMALKIDKESWKNVKENNNYYLPYEQLLESSYGLTL